MSTCEYCKAEFHNGLAMVNGHPRRYCSQQCSGLGRRKIDRNAVRNAALTGMTMLAMEKLLGHSRNNLRAIMKDLGVFEQWQRLRYKKLREAA